MARLVPRCDWTISISVPGAGDQVRRLQAAGLRCIVFTNQPEVARGLLTWDTLDQMHLQLRDATGVDEILVCPHDEPDRCACRKPRPGMLLAAAARAGICLEESVVVGDRSRDINAAEQSAAIPFLSSAHTARATPQTCALRTLRPLLT